jgi:hypothetical protein
VVALSIALEDAGLEMYSIDLANHILNEFLMLIAPYDQAKDLKL